MQTGISLFPVTFALVPTSIIVGVLVTRFGRFRWALWSGWFLTTLGTGLTILFEMHTPTWKSALIFVVCGLGHGLLLNSLNFTTQAMAGKEDAAAAAAMYTFLRSLGMAIGVAVGGSVFQNIMKIKLRHYGLPLEMATNAERYVEVVKELLVQANGQVDTPAFQKAEMILESYVYGFKGTFTFLTALAAVVGLASLCIGRYELDREHVSGHEIERRGGDEEEGATR